MAAKLSKPRSQAFMKCPLSLLLVLIASGLALSVPVPDIPPGCNDLCMKLRGVYLECIGKCPSLKRCKEATVVRDDHPEVYIGKGPIKKPQLCERHCWEANEHTERQCMLDCPLTWCQKYGNIPHLSTTTMETTMTTTTPATSTTTMPPALSNASPLRTPGPDAQPSEGQPKKYSNTHIVLGTLVLVAVVVPILGVGYQKYTPPCQPAQKEQEDVEEKLPIDPLPGPVPCMQQGDVEEKPLMDPLRGPVPFTQQGDVEEKCQMDPLPGPILCTQQGDVDTLRSPCISQ